MQTKQTGKNKLTPVHIEIFGVIVSVVVIINLCALAAGAIFLSSSISTTMENDLVIAVEIADKYVAKEIELLKTLTAEAAGDINLFYEAGERDIIPERIFAKYPRYIGLAVFDETTLIDSWLDPGRSAAGANSGMSFVTPDLIKEPFMQKARINDGIVSTTIYSSDGTFVIYVAVPINDALTLAAALPGFHFNNLISQFNFWESGHLYIWDGEGTVIANIRSHWVEHRNNFFKMAEEDSGYAGVAALVSRSLTGEAGVAHYSLDDEPRICAFRPISSSNENWSIGIVAPRSESLLKVIPRSIFLMGMITLLLSMIAAAFAVVFLRRQYDEVDRLRKEAEFLSLSKSSFLANMSHEIRTPMNSIIGFAELSLDGETSFKTRDYLKKIKTNAEWLLQIINDILDISKVETGKMELENIPFDLHELFASCRALILPKAVEKGLSLYFYVEPSVGRRLLGDPTRLRQILVNLLTNAVKFTNNGMVKLHAALKDVREDNATMSFEVKDSGIGMTPEQMERIFEPFVQAENGTTRKYGGTGLGLSITKTFVELMGGQLRLESTPGIGSKFSFDLTFDTLKSTGDETSEEKIVFNELERPAFDGEVLLCEDNPMNQQVICEHLSRIGIKTVVAENGKIGLDLVQNRAEKGEKQFDLIFMDMHMPVMDGLEASAKIRAIDMNIPIVAMTANIMTSEREVYKLHGLHDCVGKPFTSQELWRCLMKYLTPLSIEKDGEKNTQLEEDIEFQKGLQAFFVRGNQGKYSEIVKALKDNDIALAYRLAHSLKGNAAQIGKTLLQRAAANVEAKLKDDKNCVTEDMLQILEIELNTVLQELSSLREGPVSGPEGGLPLEPERISDLFETLENLLNAGNPECRNFTNDLFLIRGNDELKNKLIQQMDDFDFSAAAATLKLLKSSIG